MKYLLLGGGLVAIAALARSIWTRMSGGFGLMALGLVLIFLGERSYGFESGRYLLDGVGLLAIVASIGLRVMMLRAAKPTRASAEKLALGFSALVLAGLALYGLGLDSTALMLGLGEEAVSRWSGALHSLTGIVILAGLLPLAMLDQVIGQHPMGLPRGAAQSAWTRGLSLALALAMLFPLNYLAASHSMEYDTAYFRTTRPGESTLNLVKTLSDQVEVTLFFPPGNDVRREIEPYFNELSKSSEGKLSVTVVDQPMAPALAEELEVRDNGYVAIVVGDAKQKFRVGTDLDKAKRELKKLDATVQKNLLRTTRGKLKAYFLVGHGEANFRERDNPLRKLALFKKLMQQQNYDLRNLGVTEGSANAIPDDADLLVIAGPKKPLLPEEINAIKEYINGGGRLLVMAEPGGDDMPELMLALGVKLGNAPLAHASAHIKQNRGKADRVLIATNRYGSHAAVKTLSKNGTTLGLVVPTVRSASKAEGATYKVSTLVRSYPDTWEDSIPNLEKDQAESAETFDLAVAVEGGTGETAFRAVVVGDVTFASDSLLQYAQGNQVFLYDATRWLVGEEDIAGEVNSEEDVKIVHTNEEDQAWFWGTVLGMPLLIMFFGLYGVYLRGRKR